MSDISNYAKVIHVDVEDGWRGGQRQAFNLFESELKMGMKPHFFCKINTELHKVLSLNNYPHSALNYKGELDFLSANKISKFAKRNNNNIINCHSSHSLSLGILSKFFYSKPKLIGVRRVDFKISENFLSKWKYNTNKLDIIVCVSDAIKNIMKPIIKNPAKLTTIHSGINLNRFKDSIPSNVISEFNLQNKIIVGTVAAFAEHKDYPTFLKTIKKVTEKRNDIIFIAVGDGKLLNDMKILSKKLNIEKNIIFTEFRNDIGDFLKAFNTFILSSKEEGLGTSILDAMSVGLPIVATKAGGIPEIVKDRINGILCDIGDEQSLAEAILELAKNEQLRKTYGDNSKEFVKEFSIEVTTEKYLDLYKQLLSKI